MSIARVMRVATAGVLLTAAPAAVHGQAIGGRVVDAESGLAMEGVNVLVLDATDTTLRRSLTNAQGRFHFPVPPDGVYRVRVEHIGYAAATSDTIRVAATGMTELEFRIAPEAIALDPVVVAVDRDDIAKSLTYEGLHARRTTSRTWGPSRVVLFDDVELKHGGPIREVLRLHYPDVYPFGCMLLFLNGRPVISDLMAEAYLERNSLDFEGMEVYEHRVHAPAAFRNEMLPDKARCSILALWTRRSFIRR